MKVINNWSYYCRRIKGHGDDGPVLTHKALSFRDGVVECAKQTRWALGIPAEGWSAERLADELHQPIELPNES